MWLSFQPLLKLCRFTNESALFFFSQIPCRLIGCCNTRACLSLILPMTGSCSVDGYQSVSKELYFVVMHPGFMAVLASIIEMI
jgi:hypothetical protein